MEMHRRHVPKMARPTAASATIIYPFRHYTDTHHFWEGF